MEYDQEINDDSQDVEDDERELVYPQMLLQEEVITDDVPTQETLMPVPIKLVEVSTGKEIPFQHPVSSMDDEEGEEYQMACTPADFVQTEFGTYHQPKDDVYSAAEDDDVIIPAQMVQVVDEESDTPMENHQENCRVSKYFARQNADSDGSELIGHDQENYRVSKYFMRQNAISDGSELMDLVRNFVDGEIPARHGQLWDSLDDSQEIPPGLDMEERRKLERERKALWRAQQDEERRLQQRRRETERVARRRAEQRARETEEERRARLALQAARQAMRRANATPQQVEARRRENLLRTALRRAKDEAEREKIWQELQVAREQYRRISKQEASAPQDAVGVVQETKEQYRRHLEKSSERQRNKLLMETPEKRQLRLLKNRERMAKRRLSMKLMGCKSYEVLSDSTVSSEVYPERGSVETGERRLQSKAEDANEESCHSDVYCDEGSCVKEGDYGYQSLLEGRGSLGDASEEVLKAGGVNGEEFRSSEARIKEEMAEEGAWSYEGQHFLESIGLEQTGVKNKRTRLGSSSRSRNTPPKAEDKRERLLQYRREVQKRHLAKETPDQREKRLEKMRLSQAKRLANETPEQRERRLAKGREYAKRHYPKKKQQEVTEEAKECV